MADISSLYPDLAALRSSGISDRMRAEMALMDALNYQSAPVRRGPAGGMGRAANMIRARGARGDYFDALTSALNAEAGYNDLAAQLEALQAAQQAEAERAAKLEDYEAQKKIDQRYRAPESETPLVRNLRAAGIDPASDQGRSIIRSTLAKPGQQPSLSIKDIPDGQGGVRTVAIDPRTGQVAQDYGSKPAKPSSQLSQKDRASYQAKLTDVNEALTILDNAEKALDEAPMLAGTGPLDRFVPGKWKQGFDALADQLFAVLKRVYKAPGEGMFSDADAAALRGMMIGTGRYEDVNRKLIQDLRSMLANRQSQFANLAGEQQQGDDDVDALIDFYINK